MPEHDGEPDPRNREDHRGVKRAEPKRPGSFPGAWCFCTLAATTGRRLSPTGHHCGGAGASPADSRPTSVPIASASCLETFESCADGDGRLYATNADPATITVYDPGASGNAAPVATIAGANTQLCNPGRLALDGQGRLYTATLGTTCPERVLVFEAGATGNVNPIASRGVLGPSGIAVTP